MAIGIQATDVWSAADALLLAGDQPTIERVRAHLGRGSPNTVGPHLKAWFRTLGARLAGEGGAAEEGGAMPAPVAQAFQAVWRSANDAAREAAQAALTEQHDALATARSALDKDREALHRDAERLRQREADLVAAVGAARAQAEAAEGRARALEARLRQAEASLQTALAQRDAAQTAERTAAQALQDEQAHHQAAMSEAQRSHERAMQEAVQAQRDALAQAEQRHATHERRWLTELDSERQAARRAHKAWEQERQGLTGQVATLTARCAAAESGAGEAREALAIARAAAQQWEARCRDVQASAEAIQTALRERNTDLGTQVDAWKQQCHDAQARLDRIVTAAAGRVRRARPSAPPDEPALD
ncbi:DNA-binding protein [Achromobacter sp. GG226]|uniref:DNA-binding protein n=1 Tax=Verticiella alkaliphila TaxID=2779529 RepID=UPI001C0C29DA|nr:DNA-binding protein [Verticiella sp. GG226]MBU4610198.1 DNA-binding protein [Verticiella sp. GG226]